MNRPFDLDQYWGVQVSHIRHDFRAMAITFELFWTVDGMPRKAGLHFSGVSKCELIGERIFRSEVIELISLECKKITKGWRVVGELSNYQFAIECADFYEEE